MGSEVRYDSCEGEKIYITVDDERTQMYVDDEPAWERLHKAPTEELNEELCRLVKESSIELKERKAASHEVISSLEEIFDDLSEIQINTLKEETGDLRPFPDD